MSDSIKIEWIPAKLKESSFEPVDIYFDTRVKKQANEIYSAFLRGRELVGKNLDIPKDYKMAVYNNEDGRLVKFKDIDSFRVWKRDSESLGSSTKFLDIIEVSRILSED